MGLPQQSLGAGDEVAEVGVDAVAEQRRVRQDREGGVPQVGAPRQADRLAEELLDLLGEEDLHPGEDDEQRGGRAHDGCPPHGEQAAPVRTRGDGEVEGRGHREADPCRGDLQRGDLHDPAGDRHHRPPAPAPVRAGVVQEGEEDRREDAVGHAGADAQEVGGLGEGAVPPGRHPSPVHEDHDVVDQQVDEQQVCHHPQEPSALLLPGRGVQLDEHEDGEQAERDVAPVEEVAALVDRRQQRGHPVEDEEDDGCGQRHPPQEVEVHQPCEDRGREDLHNGCQGLGLADHDRLHEHEAHRHEPQVAQRVAPSEDLPVQCGGQCSAHPAHGVLSDRGQRSSPSSLWPSGPPTPSPQRRSAADRGHGRRRWRRWPRRPRPHRP